MKTTSTTQTMKDTYKIVAGWIHGTYEIEKNGLLLRDSNSVIRVFKTRNSARKRISREIRGDYHR